MHRHWSDVAPPAYVSMALWVGTYRAKPKAKPIESFDDLVSAFGALPGGVTAPSPLPSLEVQR